VAPESGEIVLETDDGRVDLTRKSTEEIVSLGIALVPEGRRLFPRLSVEENLLLGAYRARHAPASRAISSSASRPSRCCARGAASSPAA